MASEIQLALPPRLRVYLDTSVISACVDDRMPDRQSDTQQFWSRRGEFDLCTSTVCERELRRADSQAKRDALLQLLTSVAVHPVTPEIRQLAALYIRHEVFTVRMRRDALHVAAATVLHQDVLISWNFTHLVNRRRRGLVLRMNAELGLRTPEILAPLEL